MKNLYKTIIIMVFWFIAIGSASAAVFIKGEVTRVPWKGEYYHIKVDNVQYTIMPDVKIMLNHEKGRSYMPEKTKEQLRSIQKGATLWMSIEGNRVYQIWEEE